MPTPADSNPTSSHPPTSNPKSTHPTTLPPSSSPTIRKPPLLLALSGPTSSGKTTVATALGQIFPPPHSSLTVHADDFYKPDSQIPTRNGFQDWDCAESLDLEKFERVLRGIKAGTAHGEARLDGEEEMLRQGSFENDGVHGVSRVISPEVVERMMEDVYGWPEVVKGRKLVIVDGFLLFGKSIPDSLRGLFDVRVLLRAKYEDAKRRRERRNGYVTLEGFWQDPEGYFDGVVWPGYVREYGGMVGGGDGDELVGEGGSGGGQRVWFSEPEWGLERCLEWVVGVVRREIEDLDRGGDE